MPVAACDNQHRCCRELPPREPMPRRWMGTTTPLSRRWCSQERSPPSLRAGTQLHRWARSGHRSAVQQWL